MQHLEQVTRTQPSPAPLFCRQLPGVGRDLFWQLTATEVWVRKALLQIGPSQHHLLEHSVFLYLKPRRQMQNPCFPYHPPHHLLLPDQSKELCRCCRGHVSLSEQSCVVSRKFWVEHLHHLCSTLSTASHTIYPACLISAHQPSGWKDDHAHLSHHRGTRNSDSQKWASTPLPTSSSCPALYFHRQNLKWSDFQRAAGIYRGGCERKTSRNWR